MDEGKAVRQTTDGGFIIAGTTTSYGSGGRDILVLKTDSIGDLKNRIFCFTFIEIYVVSIPYIFLEKESNKKSFLL